MIAHGTFTAIDQRSDILSLAPNEDVEIVLTQTGSHPFRVDLVRMTAGDSGTILVTSFTSNAARVRWHNASDDDVRLRLQCVTLDSGDGESVDYDLRDSVPSGALELICVVARLDASVPGGWVLADGAAPGVVATLAKAKTGVIVYVEFVGLRVGDRIVGAYLTGNLLAASTKHTSIALSLLRSTSSAAGAVVEGVAPDASGTGFDLDVQANTVLGKANMQSTRIDSAPVVTGQTIFAKVSGTTANDDACGIELDAVVIQFVRA